jgi:hypothetical protein
MPWDGSGNYLRNFPPGGWQGDAAASIKIKADRHDQHDGDLATALSNMICKDGQSTVGADINWGAHKIVNLAAGTAPSDAVTLTQLQAYSSGVAANPSGIVISGSNPNSFLKFTGTTGPWGDSFITADVSSGASGAAGAATWMWNDKADMTGNNVMSLQENGSLTIQSLDPGAAVAPNIYLLRSSASPLAADNLGCITWMGKNLAAANFTYAYQTCVLNDPTTGSEDSSLAFITVEAGAQVPKLVLGAAAGSSTLNGNFRLQGNGAANTNSGVIYFDNGAAVNKGYLYFDGTQNSIQLYSVNNVLIAGASITLGSPNCYFNTYSAAYTWRVEGNVLNNHTNSIATTKMRVHYEGAGTAYACSYTTTATSGIVMLFAQQNTAQVGQISVTTANTVYSTTSDIRLKGDMQPASNARSLVDALNVVAFTPVDPGPALKGVEGTTPGPETHMGIPAQQAYSVYPVAVTPPDTVMEGYNPDARVGDADFRPWMIDYSKFVPMLLANVQELNARVDALEGAPA